MSEVRLAIGGRFGDWCRKRMIWLVHHIITETFLTNIVIVLSVLGMFQPLFGRSMFPYLFGCFAFAALARARFMMRRELKI